MAALWRYRELVINLKRLENYRWFQVPENFDLLGDMLHLKQFFWTFQIHTMYYGAMLQ